MDYRDENGNIKSIGSAWYPFDSTYSEGSAQTVCSATKALYKQISPLQTQLSTALNNVTSKEAQIKTLQSDIANLKAKNEVQIAELNGKLLAMAESSKSEVVEATAGTATTTRKFTVAYLVVALIALYFLKTA